MRVFLVTERKEAKKRRQDSRPSLAKRRIISVTNVKQENRPRAKAEFIRDFGSVTSASGASRVGVINSSRISGVYICLPRVQSTSGRSPDCPDLQFVGQGHPRSTE